MLWRILGFLLLILMGTFMGFYTVPPIGALPEGKTLLVFRDPLTQQFFDSPDALCLRATGELTLLCRGMALAKGPIDKIVLRLPYWDFAYTMSTGGRKFDR